MSNGDHYTRRDRAVISQLRAARHAHASGEDIGVFAKHLRNAAPSKAQMDLLGYLWIGCRLQDRSVIGKNGKVVARVLFRTITECTYHDWIEYDHDGQRYRLTDAGRDRVMVKERVREFCESLTHQPNEPC